MLGVLVDLRGSKGFGFSITWFRFSAIRSLRMTTMDTAVKHQPHAVMWMDSRIRQGCYSEGFRLRIFAGRTIQELLAGSPCGYTEYPSAQGTADLIPWM